MKIEHPPAMHHKRWWYDHCHRAETRGHSTKTTQGHCGQVERSTSPPWNRKEKFHPDTIFRTYRAGRINFAGVNEFRWAGRSEVGGRKDRNQKSEVRRQRRGQGDGCPDEIRPSTISRTYGVNFARHGHEFHGLRYFRSFQETSYGWRP